MLIQESDRQAAVLLINPKVTHNVGAALRACHIFEAGILRWTGTRIAGQISLAQEGKDRLPREERMKEYSHVDWGESPADLGMRPMEEFPYFTPVGVEIVDGAEFLDQFEHPSHAIYVFGPEDGDLPKGIRTACHRFVRVRTPNRTPLNLGNAVNLVLYDRWLKEVRS